MRLVLFDLDNTLLTGDSDYEWAQYLIDQGVLEREHYEARNDKFYEQYKSGVLDIHEFLDFQLKPLSQYSRSTLDRWHAGFMQQRIRPMISVRAGELIARHRSDTCAIITATNSFVTAPIARELGIEHLIATVAEESDGRFTGKITGTPCFREGKIACLQAWLERANTSLAAFAQSWFYSDSINDLPLLELVTHPVAVDPDPRLERSAHEKGWPILRLNSSEPHR